MVHRRDYALIAQKFFKLNHSLFLPDNIKPIIKSDTSHDFIVTNPQLSRKKITKNVGDLPVPILNCKVLLVTGFYFT